MAWDDEVEEWDAPDAQPSPPRRFAGLRRLANALGALASLALVVGIVIWGYKLVMRDVHGVPVVRAIEGPLRVQPENPGGESASHQGLAVNRIAAEGSAAPTADTLRLAPRPITLDTEDVPMASLQPDADAKSGGEDNTARRDAAGAADESGAEQSGPAPVTDRDDMGQDDEVTPGEVAPDMAGPDSDGIAGPQEDDMNETDPIPHINEPVITESTPETEEGESETGPGSIPAGAIDALLAEAMGGGAADGAEDSSAALRPQSRPGDTSEAASRAAFTDPLPRNGAAPETREISPETLEPGTPLVQLGALDSMDAARAEWTRLAGRFGSYLAGKDRVIQQASSGGHSFYRLRAAGFADMAEARRFCAALLAEEAECIPVAAR